MGLVQNDTCPTRGSVRGEGVTVEEAIRTAISAIDLRSAFLTLTPRLVSVVLANDKLRLFI